MSVRWMRAIICALLIIAIIGNIYCAEASGNIRIIVKLQAGALIGPILTLLGADLLDSIPAINLYLLRVPNIPVLTFTLQLLGVLYIENDTTLNNPSSGPIRPQLTMTATVSRLPISTAPSIPAIQRFMAT